MYSENLLYQSDCRTRQYTSSSSFRHIFKQKNGTYTCIQCTCAHSVIQHLLNEIYYLKLQYISLMLTSLKNRSNYLLFHTSIGLKSVVVLCKFCVKNISKNYLSSLYIGYKALMNVNCSTHIHCVKQSVISCSFFKKYFEYIALRCTLLTFIFIIQLACEKEG